MLRGPRWQRPLPGTVLDPANDLAAKLGACFLFNEATGAPREMFSGTSVALTGGTSWGAASWPQMGPCFQGNGTTGFGTITLSGINSWTSFSVGFLWNCAAGAYDASGRILEKGSNNDWAFVEDAANPNCIQFSVGGTQAATSGVTCFDGKWHMVHGTYDGLHGPLYIDGQVVASLSTVSGKTGGTAALNFMQYGGSGFHTASKFAGLWIWQNRVLSAGEVKDHAREPWQMFLAGGLDWLSGKATGSVFSNAPLLFGF